MNAANVIAAVLCLLIAGMIFLSLLRDVLHWIDGNVRQSYQDGYERGRRDADVAWVQAEKQVERTQKEIWREEASQ